MKTNFFNVDSVQFTNSVDVAMKLFSYKAEDNIVTI